MKIKLKSVLENISSMDIRDQMKMVNKVAKMYGGVHCKKCKGVGSWFEFPIKDYPSAGTQIVTKAGRDILKKETENAKRRASKAAKKMEKYIEDVDIQDHSPTGVHGSIWLWVMI